MPQAAPATPHPGQALRRLNGPLGNLAARVHAGERLGRADALLLYREPDLTAVGALANLPRERRHGSRAFYIRNQHINYTNVCCKQCRFCYFARSPRDGGAESYTLSPDEVRFALRRHASTPITEVHMVGGIDPKLPYRYYLELLEAVQAERPGVHIKAFTAVELVQIAEAAGKPLDETLAELRAAGLSSVPGGGAEVMSPRVHAALYPRKLDADGWEEVARAVARAGLPQYATMLYGHMESVEERVDHLLRLRALQDETGHFLAFTPLSFHPEGTWLDHLPEPTGFDDLRSLAVARLVLDNFAHIKTFWVMNTPQVSQAALWYGADDMDGTVHEYEITYPPGEMGRKRQALTRPQLIALIEEAGRTPVERDSLYREQPSPQEARRATRAATKGIDDIAERSLAGERLCPEDGARLFAHPSLTDLAALAHAARERLNPDPVVTYILGRNVNYTNVCWVRCRFCAFHCAPGHPMGYVLSHSDLLREVEQMVEAGGIEVLLQGGLNPRLRIDWFEGLFRRIKERFGADGVTLHALSPTEVLHIARVSGLSAEECIRRLRDAGLDSIPGGGAEILTDRVRQAISPRKHTAAEWLDCMRTAHGLGVRTTATMMYGSVDTWEDRIEHLLRIRALQEETRGFTAFIPWSFQPDDTELGGQRASAFDYLRTVAVSRLLLDNVPHLQASWVTQGPKVAQIALRYGLDDFGSSMMKENVVSAAGCAFTMPVAEIERLIRTAGFEAARRTTQYARLPTAGDPVP
ncbi:MAG TPA: cyclic dehypoxanthinyl futalosine synthase [Chthonomonadales bacterium]|nr:cyclic dehypoxanthinyl futalosine synthase [Chthonomonadales bacterium]